MYICSSKLRPFGTGVWKRQRKLTSVSPSSKYSRKPLRLSQAQHSFSRLGSGLQARCLSTTVDTSLRSKNARTISNAAAVSEYEDDWLKNTRGGKENERLLGTRGEDWWTGISPAESPKVVIGETGGIHSLPQLCLEGLTRKELQEYFDNSWLHTEILFSSLQGEEAFMRPPYHNLRHPLVFYYGHPASFYVNKLRVAGLLSSGLNDHFETIFEVGVDEMRWDDISYMQKDWPAVSEVHEYRQQVYQTVTNVITEAFQGDEKKKIRIVQDDPMWAVLMGVEHEKIHLETSSVLFRELPSHLLRTPENFVPTFKANGSRKDKNPTEGVDFPKNELIPVQGGTVFLGKDREYPSFGWDNEYGSRKVEVPHFSASKFMVSNGEFYEFVASGGYRNQKYWNDDGWGWRRFRNRKWPFFWEQRGPAGSHEYGLRTLFEVIDMPWSWPAIVNYHEASAFSNWKTEQLERNGTELVAPLRMVTEAEHQLLRGEEHRNPISSWEFDPALKLSGKDFGEKAGANLNLAYGSETPVDFHKANENGFHDVIGNAWEWAEDDFNPLEGFEVHPYYDDFSSPCFGGEHTMLLGGSFMSCGDAGANLHCRYHFRPHFLQHSGFRYVAPSKAEKNIKGENIAVHIGEKAKLHQSLNTSSQFDYESDLLLNQYLSLHYGQSPEVVNATVRSHEGRPDHALDFPRRSAELLFEVASIAGSKTGAGSRALDIGCAVGGASFTMAEKYAEVVGLEYSKAFVEKANDIRNGGENGLIKFQVPTEGTESMQVVTSVPPQSARDATNFIVGDACNMPSVDTFHGGFDGILMANLMCRLPNPQACIDDLKRISNPGCAVLIISPYSWLSEFTDKENWLQSPNQDSATELVERMDSQGFQKILSRDVPLIIREHERKYQYIVSHALGFIKRN